LLCRIFKKKLFRAFFYPSILPAPHKMNVVGHDNEAVKPNPFVMHHKLEAVYQYLLAFICLKKHLPVKASSGEELNAIGHSTKVKNILETIARGSRFGGHGKVVR